MASVEFHGPWQARQASKNFGEPGMTIENVVERRRRDKSIAWGVSPRYCVSQHPKAPERGRQIAAAASAAAMIFRLSVAASRLEEFIPAVFLGLTPQAMSMPPLRG